MLIRGAACVWSGNSGAQARLDARSGTDIRIRGSQIEALGRLTPQPGEPVLDAQDCVIQPGWVNTHHHLFQSLLKGVPSGLDLPLNGWLSAVPVRWRRGLDQAELFRLAVRVGLVELMLSGCSTVTDHQYHYYPGIAFDPGAIVFEEAARLGLRLVLARGGQTRARQVDLDPGPANAPETLEAFLAGLALEARRFHDPAPQSMRRVVCAPTTPTWSVHPQELRLMADEARRLGLRLHSHLSETQDYVSFCQQVHGCSPVEFMAAHDWLGPDVWFAHLVHLSGPEIALLARSGSGMAHCPQSNGRLGSGIAPVRELRRMGVPVSLAVDGAASNEAADMLSEAHACWLMQRAASGADALTVPEVIAMGTSQGAQVLGLDGVGRIAPGMAADLVIYTLDEPAHWGLHDPGIGPVISGKARVKALLVHGQVCVRDGEIPGLDRAELAHAARAGVAQLRDRLGV